MLFYCSFTEFTYLDKIIYDKRPPTLTINIIVSKCIFALLVLFVAFYCVSYTIQCSASVTLCSIFLSIDKRNNSFAKSIYQCFKKIFHN